MDQIAGMLLSWQSVVLAVGASVLSQAVKKVLDIFLADGDSEKRKAWHPAITELLIPGLPILWGTLLTVLVPLRPDVLTQYVQEHGLNGLETFMVRATWGALMVGVPADWLYRRFKGVLKMKKKVSG